MANYSGIPMFHKRLLLLAGLMAAGALVPIVRTATLTISRGELLRSVAEGRLVTQTWVPTMRGKILDRKGRVLARDVPSFEVAVDYSLISGQWAFNQAAAAARKAHKEWNELSPLQREGLVQELVPGYQERLHRSWEALAAATHVPAEDLEETRSGIVERVTKMAAQLTEVYRQQAQRDALQRGRELTTVATADVVRPIREQEMAHVLVRGINDKTAFEFPRGSAAEEAGLLPGMRLRDGEEREYPLTEVDLSIDRSGFPAALRNEKPLAVTVQGVGTPLVGWMRNTLYKEDVARKPLRRKQDGVWIIDPSGYTEGDAVGQSGMEAIAEDDLRGTRGAIVEQLDTGQTTETERAPGKDVALTIDAHLQGRIQALMGPDVGLMTVHAWQNNHALPEGTHLQGAVVVMDVETSDILALVSTPTYTREQMKEDPEGIFTSEADKLLLEKAREYAIAHNQPPPGPGGMVPLLNRATGRAYAPGSIVKPLVLAAAVTEGVFDANGRIACHGFFQPDKPNSMRCWIYKQSGGQSTHNLLFGHDLDGSEAIMVSCNIFFFTLGKVMGPARMADWYGKYGVGDEPGVKHPRLNIGYQFPGALGTIGRSVVDIEEIDEPEIGEGNADGPEFIRLGEPVKKRSPRVVSHSDAILMGIGQGPIAWTPLHAADAYATLARGGVRILPRLRVDGPVDKTDLHLNPAGVALALSGLDKSVNDDRGTGNHLQFGRWDGVTIHEPTFNLPGVKVWGKSGTADSGRKVEKGSAASASFDHSWFVVLVGDAGGKPKYVVSVLVEYGGSGGKVAGPLCNQVLWALRAEGYL